MAKEKSDLGLLIGVMALLLVGSIIAAITDHTGIMTGPGVILLFFVTYAAVRDLWNTHRGKAFLVIFLFLVFTGLCIAAAYAYDDAVKIALIVVSDIVGIAEIVLFGIL